MVNNNDIAAPTMFHDDGNGGGSGGNAAKRMVVVRYYLDRPGYDASHSSARFWLNPPTICRPTDIRQFLSDQFILEGFSLRDEIKQEHQAGAEQASPRDEDDDVYADKALVEAPAATRKDEIIVEVRLDEYQTYMSLEACGSNISFDFTKSTVEKPATLTLRLTDVTAILNDAAAAKSKSTYSQEAATVSAGSPMACNMTPAGLFAFSMIVGMEATETTGKLLGATSFSSEGFQLIYGPYGFFVGGLLQLCVGMWEVTRNNIYGATAFSAFGCFWLGNGTKLILTSYFRDFINPEFLIPDPWGNCMRNLYILLLAMILVKQTLVMTKVTTTLVVILCVSQFLLTMAGFYTTVAAIQSVVGWILSGFAMFTFYAEFTNEVYQRELYNLYPWNTKSIPQVAAAVGRTQTLQSVAATLRARSVVVPLRTAGTIPEEERVVSVRAASPSSKGTFFGNKQVSSRVEVKIAS